MSNAWPGGARGALSLSFDNLGEAAEVGAGAHERAEALGGHPTATVAVPEILVELAARGLRATFFVEGLNAEVYPELLERIEAEGHEVAYHAWAHEQWAELDATHQAENLARGIAAFERIGLRPSGMRPPGGGLGEGGARVLREAGMRYGSPAGTGAGVDDGIALLGFQWRHVDASCVLPGLDAVRAAQTGGAGGPIGPGAFLAHLEAEIARLGADGDYATIVLHPFMREWFGAERLAALLDRVAAVAADELWVSPCREVAEHVLGDPGAFAEGMTPDPTGWAG